MKTKCGPGLLILSCKAAQLLSPSFPGYAGLFGRKCQNPHDCQHFPIRIQSGRNSHISRVRIRHKRDSSLFIVLVEMYVLNLMDLFSYATRVKAITNNAQKNVDSKEIAQLKEVCTVSICSALM